MLHTNLKNLFENAGLENIRPTEQALAEMKITRRRFTLLLENDHKTPISVEEMEAIKVWIEGIKAIDTDQVIGESNSLSDLADSLGMTKR